MIHHFANRNSRFLPTCLAHKNDKIELFVSNMFSGGYHHPNAARLWTKLTAVAAVVDLDDDIPEHDDWPQYGPDYKILIEPSLTKDRNTEQYLSECIEKIKCK